MTFPAPTTISVEGRLRAAAVRYCAAGWPILPVYLDTDGLVCGRPPADAAAAHEWWSERAYGIACRTGELFDVLRVPRWLGERMLPAVEHSVTVVEVEKSAECPWFFLVTADSSYIPDLPHVVSGVSLLGSGGLVLLPPTPSVRWVVRQAELHLPHSLTLQWAAFHAAIAARRESGDQYSTRQEDGLDG
jgi:hypothetical protein